jgi:hypothetical protein
MAPELNMKQKKVNERKDHKAFLEATSVVDPKKLPFTESTVAKAKKSSLAGQCYP